MGKSRRSPVNRRSPPQPPPKLPPSSVPKDFGPPPSLVAQISSSSELPSTSEGPILVANSSVLPLEATVAASTSQISEPESKTQPIDSDPSSAVDSASSPLQRSWVDLVKGPSEKMVKKGTPFILDSGELCVQIPNEVITRNHKRWESFIIGQFHGNLPSAGALHAIFNGIWSNRYQDITASRLGPRSVLIRIPCPATRKRVLSQGIWHIEGQTMFVAEWEPGLNPVMPELTEAPVWLEFRGVPPHFFYVEGFEHVAGVLGHPIYCHLSTVNMTNLEVGKGFTVIDPTKPLPEAVNVQFATGEIHRVAVSCPWLPPICSHCNQIGHSIHRCPTAPITCLGCNSSSHNSENCPRAKIPSTKVKSKAKAQWKKKSSEVLPIGIQIDVDDVINPNSRSSGKSVLVEDSVVVCKKALDVDQEFPPPRKSISGMTSGNLVVDIGLGSLPLHKAGSSHKLQPPSSPLSSESDTVIEYSSSESSSEEEEEGEVREEVEVIPFTKVLSKKARRQERNATGKSPKSKNH